MKGIFIILLSLVTHCTIAQSRVINLDSLKAVKKPKTEAELIKDAKPTDIDVIYKSEKHKVYLSKNGKYFYVLQSPTSKNWYRRYIKEL